MPTQQIVSAPSTAAVFLTFTVRPGAEEELRGVLADVSGLTRSVGFRHPGEHLLCVVGLGSCLWDRLFDLPRPAHLHPFAEVRGAVHTAPSTPGDLFVHLRAGRLDLCFELARVLGNALDGLADVVDEVHGFRYFDQRDLLGFVDGTENPEGEEATEAAVVGEQDPAYAGGSYVIVQKYLHDLDAWGALSTEQQEAAIGRTKLDDLELDDDVKPSNSHVALNDISDDDGEDLDIFRDNMPFGSIAGKEFGTYFIGYAADPGITEQMLENMFVGVPEGNHDRILDFSTAVTGGLFFCPPLELLDAADEQPLPGGSSGSAGADVGGAPEGSAGTDSDSASGSGNASDGSLGIGSLRA